MLTDLANERMAQLQLDNSKEGQQRQIRLAMVEKEKRKDSMINTNSTSRKELIQKDTNMNMPQIQIAKRTGIIAKQATI